MGPSSFLRFIDDVQSSCGFVRIWGSQSLQYVEGILSEGQTLRGVKERCPRFQPHHTTFMVGTPNERYCFSYSHHHLHLSRSSRFITSFGGQRMAEIWTKLMLRCHATISISNHTYLDGTKMGASWLAPDSTETRERR